MKTRLKSRKLYTVGWIAVLDFERTAAMAMLDDRHDAPEDFCLRQTDSNSYTWGRIGEHNIVITSLPAGMKGLVPAAVVASNMVFSFPKIKFGLCVGVGGALARPGSGHDIRLGDVVVSQPDGESGGVIQYDSGKANPNQSWEHTGHLNKPPGVLLSALPSLKAEGPLSESIVPDLLEIMWTTYPKMAKNDEKSGFVHQGFENDRLFDSTYNHVGGRNCEQCDEDSQVIRKDRKSTDPKIHYGVIASGNTLVRDAVAREKIAAISGGQCLCFEMEAAGLMNDFPCLVIRGISDYADSHKNDRWQRYAAATAAVYAKELLGFVHARSLTKIPDVVEVIKSISEDLRIIRDDTSSMKEQVRSVKDTLLSMDQKAVIDRLQTVTGASFDSSAEGENPTCLPDTRVALLDKIMKWTQEPTAEPIFWLDGMAGTGKSTISRTIAQRLDNECRLGASFFFKRSEADRRTSARLFTTIASQLAAKNPALATHIKHAIDADTNIDDKRLDEQFENLILGPLSKMPLSSETPKSLILVIDALDECEAEIKQVESILRNLCRVKKEGLKVFITSRPEHGIRLSFGGIEGSYESEILHETADNIIESDLSVFIKHELLDIHSKYNRSSSYNNEKLPGDWPGEPTIQCLVKMSKSLFIFAATVCRFVADWRCGGPDEQLRRVLEYRSMSEESQLAATYLPVLDNLFATKRQRDQILELFRLVVGTIVVLEIPLPTESLANMILRPTNIVNDHLGYLHSVLSIRDGSPVRLLHLSFCDFLTDPGQDGHHDFWINKTEAHGKTLDGCLRTLKGFLRVDMCNLRDRDMEHTTIDNGSTDEYIPMLDAVYSFLQMHFLHWVEALSLMGRADKSVGMLKTLQISRYRIETKSGDEFISFLNDASQFLRASMSIIRTAPLQLYYSALLFAPRNSIIRKLFWGELPSRISHPPKTADTWGNVIQAVKFNGDREWGDIKDVMFSPDSKLIATCHCNRSVYLWDAGTGVQLVKIKGHSHAITSMSFSANSELIATSALPETVIRVPEAGGVLSLPVFSGDSTLVASADLQSVFIWCTRTGARLQTLEGATVPVTISPSHLTQVW
ncbi:hypothetical protein FSARC_9749 [Fusarium sarcochroum]|uniref:NACHT domain-containing protein n=1 Tax=Fusarium sarcochroum TaxID=1208366 RepID=A0A8H4TQE2_9HYPO|nr:hypothetical protein FSARC_9749 [Fusarium sarcochroum]